MDINKVFSVLAGIIVVIAFIPYIKGVWLKETRPRKASWFIWAVGDWIILAGMIANKTINGLIVAACIGATTVFILTLKFGQKGWTKIDKICICLSTLAIVLWQIFGDSNLGIGFSLLSLVIAALPTFISAQERPQNEDATGWIMFNISNVFGLLGIAHLTFADMAPPITFFLIDITMLYLIIVRPVLLRRLAQAKETP